MRGGSSSQQPPALIMPADGPDARLYETAIRRAIEMVNADGGVIATLDDTGQTMVLRVRQVHPRLQPEPQLIHHSASRPHAIEEAATTVLPAAQFWRFYRPGERLIGYVWQTGKPVIMTGDEVRGLPSGSSPEDPDAPFHLAVPIFAAFPGEDEQSAAEPQVIGVLAVHVTDPRWPFTQNHIHLLQAQAQNIAQALLLTRVMHQEQSHRRLLALLRELTSDLPIQPDIDNFIEKVFERVYIAIRGMFDTDAFAIVLVQTPSTSRPLEQTLTFAYMVDAGQRYPPMQVREDQAPWWSWVRVGRAVGWITDDDRRNNPQLRQRDWGSQRYLDSQLFVPMKTSAGVIGALLVASARSNAYTGEHVALLEMAGRYIALAVENAQMRRNRRLVHNSESDRTLALLNNSLLALNATLDVDTIIRGLVESASELARGQACAYLEYDTKADELIIRDAVQNKDRPYQEVIGQRLQVGEGRRRQAVEGQIVPLDDLTTEYKRGDAIAALLERYHVQAMLLVPVIYSESITLHDRVLGLLAIFTPDQRGLFTPAEEMNLMALGRVAASAIHNARTYAQLRELDRLKDEFILTASHEFRTPMSAIQGFSWLIQRRVESMTPEQAQHWSGEIARATEQLKDMMDTITEAWRTKSVQMPPLQSINLAEMTRLALEVSAPFLAAGEHTPQIQVSEDLWVLGDQDRLRHVISNLLTNAAKYSPEHSQIAVSATMKTAEELLATHRERGARDEDDDRELVAHVTPGSGPWVVLSVRDMGMGISAANQKKLFAKFVRLELTTNVRGTGLGLYICRRYIEAMGGEVWVESAPGQGSTFSFCLPDAPAPTMPITGSPAMG
jgi:signal transduction histidine kinase